MVETDNPTKKLLNGTIVYFIGNALTQIISLLLLRFVTGHISSEEYGIYNLVVTVSNLVTPLLTLQISEALFKFFITSENIDQKKQYYTISLVITAVSSVLTVLGVFLVHNFIFTIPHPVLVALYMVTTNVTLLSQKTIRSLGKNTVFVKANFIKTLLFLVLQIFFIYVFDLQAEALFLAVIISSVVSIIIVEISVRSKQYVSLQSVNKSAVRQMLKFSVPLIPNAAFWWLTSSVNSVIVSTQLGLDINGIYTVANKFSNVLTMVTSVFIMSWQESAISEYGSEKFKSFFTKTFSMYYTLVFSAIAVLIPFINMVLPYMIDPSYYPSIQYAPVLLFSSCLSTISGFFAQIFSAQNKTHRNITTTSVGMAVNLIIVLLLVDSIGLWAAAVGTVLSHAVSLVVRAFMVREEFTKEIEWLKIITVTASVAVGMVLYYTAGTVYSLAWFAFNVVLAVVLNFTLVKQILGLALEKLKIGKRK